MEKKLRSADNKKKTKLYIETTSIMHDFIKINENQLFIFYNKF
jgi:hypothetical protein